MVFRPVSRGNMGEFSLDGHMLTVLLKLDGLRDIATVARALNINLRTMRSIISKLLELQLVERGEEAIPVLGKDFFDFITAQLSLAIGPIAEMLLEDVVDEMGLDMKKMPIHRAAELVDYLSREIPDQEKRLAFQQAILQRLRKIES